MVVYETIDCVLPLLPAIGSGGRGGSMQQFKSFCYSRIRHVPRFVQHSEGVRLLALVDAIRVQPDRQTVAQIVIILEDWYLQRWLSKRQLLHGVGLLQKVTGV